MSEPIVITVDYTGDLLKCPCCGHPIPAQLSRAEHRHVIVDPQDKRWWMDGTLKKEIKSVNRMAEFIGTTASAGIVGFLLGHITNLPSRFTTRALEYLLWLVIVVPVTAGLVALVASIGRDAAVESFAERWRSKARRAHYARYPDVYGKPEMSEG